MANFPYTFPFDFDAAGDTALTPGIVELVLATFAPTIVTTSSVAICIPTPLALSLTTFAPAIILTAGTPTPWIVKMHKRNNTLLLLSRDSTFQMNNRTIKVNTRR